MNYEQIKIRNVKREDGPALISAERRISLEPGLLLSAPHEILPEAFQDKIRELSDNPRGVYLVAEIDSHVVGHGYLNPMYLEAIQHVADLTLAIHTGHQGHGIGERLLVQMLEWARNCSRLEKIEAQIRSTNTRAISLCKKVGFKEEGRWLRRIKLANDQYVDDVVMGYWL
jgi:RimJ/RimL family protein N-acetyltransferase